jgi:hypothetical protein
MAIQKNNLNLLVSIREEKGLTRRELALLVAPRNAFRQDINDAMREILQIETGTRSRCLPRLERALKALRVNVPQLELDLAAWAAKRGGHCGWAEYLPDLTPVCIPGFCVATIGNPEKNFIIVTVGFAPPHDAEHFGAGRLMFKFTTKSGDLLAGVDGRPPVPVESIEIWTGGDAEVENFQEFLTCAPVALRAWGAGGQNP